MGAYRNWKCFVLSIQKNHFTIQHFVFWSWAQWLSGGSISYITIASTTSIPLILAAFRLTPREKPQHVNCFSQTHVGQYTKLFRKNNISTWNDDVDSHKPHYLAWLGFWILLFSGNTAWIHVIKMTPITCKAQMTGTNTTILLGFTHHIGKIVSFLM